MKNQTRIIIENVKPQLDGGSFFVKRIVGQQVIVTANVFADGNGTLTLDKDFTELHLFGA